MNLLFEIVITQGFVLDIFGVIGLGLVALAAIRMARHLPVMSARLMSGGAIALIAGRLGFLIFGYFVGNHPAPGEIHPLVFQIVGNVNVALLTAGLGMIVWGFWRHEQHVSGELPA